MIYSISTKLTAWFAVPNSCSVSSNSCCSKEAQKSYLICHLNKRQFISCIFKYWIAVINFLWTNCTNQWEFNFLKEKKNMIWMLHLLEISFIWERKIRLFWYCAIYLPLKVIFHDYHLHWSNLAIMFNFVSVLRLNTGRGPFLFTLINKLFSLSWGILHHRIMNCLKIIRVYA